MSEKIKVFICLGTRADIIKMSPVVLEINQNSDFISYTCLSGQHKELAFNTMEALNKKGWNVMSMDISKEMLSQNALPLSIIGDIQAIPTLDKHFDLVVCRQGLQYVDIKKALYEMKRICKGKIILGHITKEKEDKYDFWTEYFKIASPGRKHIFEPEYIEKKAQELGMRVIDRKIIHQSDYYVGPLLHLDEEKQNYLISLILNTTTDFKNMYNVQITDANDIMYSNRWEFITIQLN